MKKKVALLIANFIFSMYQLPSGFAQNTQQVMQGQEQRPEQFRQNMNGPRPNVPAQIQQQQNFSQPQGSSEMNKPQAEAARPDFNGARPGDNRQGMPSDFNGARPGDGHPGGKPEMYQQRPNVAQPEAAPNSNVQEQNYGQSQPSSGSEVNTQQPSMAGPDFNGARPGDGHPGGKPEPKLTPEQLEYRQQMKSQNQGEYQPSTADSNRQRPVYGQQGETPQIQAPPPNRGQGETFSDVNSAQPQYGRPGNAPDFNGARPGDGHPGGKPEMYQRPGGTMQPTERADSTNPKPAGGYGKPNMNAPQGGENRQGGGPGMNRQQGPGGAGPQQRPMKAPNR